jgi:predicted phosphodiesterase
VRIAIISDSHGNLTALDAVLADLDRNGPFDEILMGGDAAYGGPYPRECVDRVIESGFRTVRGNTDQMIIDAVSGAEDPHGQWVVEQLEQRHIDFLNTLPIQVNVEPEDGPALGLVHATPWSIHKSVLPDCEDDVFERMLADAGTHALAYGHVHVQHQRNLPTGVVVAVGSLGLPFDGDQRAMYTVIELSSRSWNVEFRRVMYDVEKAIDEARNSGSPNGAAFARNLISASRP